MAIHTDPQTGQPREVDEMVRPTTNSSWLGMIVLLIGLALAGLYFYVRVGPTVDTTTQARLPLQSP